MKRKLFLGFLKPQLSTITIPMVLLLALMSYVNGSYFFCASLATLTRGSNVVGLGSIERIIGSYLSRGQVYGSDTSDYAFNLTIFEFRIVSYAKGAGPGFAYILDDGDATFRSELGIREETVVRVGESYVLFLSNDWSCAPSPPWSPCTLPPTPLKNTFHIGGGLQGKFHIVNNRVYRVDICRRTDLAAMNGMSTDEFLARAYVAGHSSFIIATVLAALAAVGGGAVLFVGKRWSLRTRKPKREESVLSTRIPPVPPSEERTMLPSPSRTRGSIFSSRLAQMSDSD